MDISKVMERLCLLNGIWKGTGSGQYPTIDSFEYEETLRFEADNSYPLIHYEQKTILSATKEASHWESGFIRVVESGAVEISNSQDSGRVEVLRGELEPSLTSDDGFRLELASVCLGNDPRLVQTKRMLTVEGDVLSYQKFMSTRTTEKPSLMMHLEARLLRVL